MTGTFEAGIALAIGFLIGVYFGAFMLNAVKDHLEEQWSATVAAMLRFRRLQVTASTPGPAAPQTVVPEGPDRVLEQLVNLVSTTAGEDRSATLEPTSDRADP